jgi:hypothetical protein
MGAVVFAGTEEQLRERLRLSANIIRKLHRQNEQLQSQPAANGSTGRGTCSSDSAAQCACSAEDPAEGACVEAQGTGSLDEACLGLVNLRSILGQKDAIIRSLEAALQSSQRQVALLTTAESKPSHKQQGQALGHRAVQLTEQRTFVLQQQHRVLRQDYRALLDKCASLMW